MKEMKKSRSIFCENNYITNNTGIEKISKRTKGITLIALIITIIVMLILAGVVLNLTIGERGIFKTAKGAGSEYEKSQVREEIQLALIDIETEELENGNIVTLERLAGEEKLLEKKLDGITADLVEDKIIGIYKDYEYEIDGKLHVTIKNVDNKSITFDIIKGTVSEDKWYKTNVEVKLTATNEDTAKIVYKINENQEVEVERKETNITIDSEGENTIVYYAILTNGNKTENTEKKIKIDKTNPQIINTTIQDISTDGFTIKVDAQDGGKSTEIIKSGIKKYEYCIKSSSEENYKTYESTDKQYIFSNLKPDTEYQIYVIVYDKANNTINSETITQETKSVPKNIYIDAINGDDTLGDGTESKPYKTLQNIENVVVQGFSYNINLNDGSYEFTNSLLSLNANKEISIIGKGKNTEISATKVSSNTRGYTLKFCKLVWNANSTVTNVFSTWLDVEFHNVVFYNMASNANDYFLPNDHGATDYTVAMYTFDHCTLPTYALNTVTVCQGGKFKFINNYGGFASGWGTSDENWLDTTCNYITSNPKVDSEYRIIDSNCTEEYGVYYGEFAWK